MQCSHGRSALGAATRPGPRMVRLPHGASTMTGLNVSLSFLLITCGLCEAARRAARALLPAGTYISFAQEAAGAFQLVACGLEMRALADVGPWAAGVGPDLLLTLLFLLFLLHGATLDGALGNPAVALQELLLAEASLPSTLLKLVAQGLGMMAARALTLRCWALELSELHLLQSLVAAHCSSTLRTSVPHGALLEAAGAFIFHLGLLYLRRSLPARRVPSLALLATFTTHTVGPYTSAFFNPVLATSATFHCEGHTLVEYAQVYWLGPLAGMILAVLLHQGHLPGLFQTNLLYRPKNKYRGPPRGRLVPPSSRARDRETQALPDSGRGRVGGAWFAPTED